MREIKFTFTEKQTAFEKAVDRYPVVLMGGARGGGKSYGLRNIMLKRRFLYPGTHGVIFRRTYEELESNHIRKIMQEHPWLKKHYRKQERLIEIPNGSTLEFCHCRFMDELDLYQGREWEDLGIDEAGQWPEEWVQRLRGSNRTSKPGLEPRTLLTGNPGGLGHAWLKRLFVSRHYNPREKPSEYAFVQSFVQDNPAIMEHDPGYVARLEAEPNEMLRRAFLYGDWDLQAGQFFTELEREVHVVKAFVIPSHWRRIVAFDPGYNHPASAGWFAVNEDGDMFMYRFYIERGKRIDEIAHDICEAKDTQKAFVVGGHDCWSHGRDGGPTIADQFSTLPDAYRLHLTKANIDRLQGAAEVRKRLAHRNLPPGVKGPTLYFFDRPDVRRAYESLCNMTHNPQKPEDVLKTDASMDDKYSGDEAYDVIRYAVASWPGSSKHAVVEQEMTVEQNRTARAERWHKKQRLNRKRGKQQNDPVLGKMVH